VSASHLNTRDSPLGSSSRYLRGFFFDHQVICSETGLFPSDTLLRLSPAWLCVRDLAEIKIHILLVYAAVFCVPVWWKVHGAAPCLDMRCPWAALSDDPEREGASSPRNKLAADHVAWAFWKSLPGSALRYFISRASQEDLRRQITYMLRGVDHPDVVAFLPKELAIRAQALEVTKSPQIFHWMVENDWKRWHQERSRSMSQESRERLRELWAGEVNDIHLRKQSFRLWAATSHPDDLPVLRSLQSADFLEEDVLRARLERGDKTAIPRFIDKIRADDTCYRWLNVRDIWSDELTSALDEQLTPNQSKGALRGTSMTACFWPPPSLDMANQCGGMRCAFPPYTTLLPWRRAQFHRVRIRGGEVWGSSQTAPTGFQSPPEESRV